MRESYDRPQTSVLTWLLCSVISVYLVQSVLLHFFGMSFDWDLGLSAVSLRTGHFWAPFTYGFLHDTGFPLQVVGYLLAIYFIGREVLPVVGNRRFIALYLVSLAVGGLVYTAIHWRHPVLLLGSSAAVSALLIVFACFYPNREMTLLLFFVLPVNVKPKHLAFGLLAVDLFGFVFYEILDKASPLGFAHSAHLGGMAAGWIYFRYLHDSGWSLGRGAADIELPRWMKGRKASDDTVTAPTYRVNLDDRGSLRAEVDRILDKINSNGFGSLSAKEKKILDDARDLIGRR